MCHYFILTKYIYCLDLILCFSIAFNNCFFSLQYSVVEFSDGSVHAVPSKWLKTGETGVSCSWPLEWSDSKIRKFIENCCDADTSDFLPIRVRVLHSYSKKF